MNLRLSALLGVIGFATATLGYSAENARPAAATPPAKEAATSATAATGPKEWRMDDLLPSVQDLGKGRNFAQGKKMFAELACGGCHAFSTYSQGGGLAPDLTPVGSKLTREAILQAILEPSAEINGQYHATKFTLKNGNVVEGALVDTVEGKYILVPALLAPALTIEVKESDVASEEISETSQMPAGLLNASTRDQILDLLAFLISGGQSDAAVFQK